MSGLIRAELLRFRKRRSLQIIVIAVPLLVAFFFFTTFASVGDVPPPFDAEAVRARILAENFSGLGRGVPVLHGSLFDEDAKGFLDSF